MMHQIKNIITFEPVGSEALYLTVRAAFIAKGGSLNRWCISNGVNRQTVEKALKGERAGRRSGSLLRRVIEASMPGELDKNVR